MALDGNNVEKTRKAITASKALVAFGPLAMGQSLMASKKKNGVPQFIKSHGLLIAAGSLAFLVLTIRLRLEANIGHERNGLSP